jgi:sigma-B regulation protein RsbU (phosphoserine phosphatase)
MLSFFNKKKSGYPRSFAKRLTWRIMLRMLIFMGIPAALVFGVCYYLVYAGAIGLCDRLVSGEHEEIRRITSDLYVASVNTAPVIEENLDRPDKIQEIINRMLRKNPYMRSCGISFVENYYPKKGRWFCPFAVRVDSDSIETYVMGDAKHDYLNEAWFKEALSRNEGYWGKAFIDSVNQQRPIVSYQMPIHDKRDSTVAILHADLSLDWLNDKIQFFRAKTDSTRKKSVTIRYDLDKDNNWDPEDAVYYFLVDTTGTLLVHPDQKRVLKRNIKEYVSEDPNDAIGGLLDRYSDEEDDVIIDGERILLSFMPVKYTNWCLALVIPAFIVELIAYIFGGISILIILIGMLAVYFFGRRTIKKSTLPLKQLAYSANEVAKGNFATTLLPLKSNDEIHMLRDSFEQMQRSLTRYVEELKSTTAQKASIESELKVAHNIQMSMLPKTFPPYPDREDIDIFGQLTPAKAVGGDLFDFYIRDEQLYFCIGDVSGKGVPASLFMAVTRSLFRNVSNHQSKPHLIMKALNDSLVESNEMNMFVTLFVGVLDLQTGLLRYCNAGHDAPLLIGLQRVDVLPCDSNLPIGVIADFDFSEQTILIDKYTTIFLFTDGLNEAENCYQEQFSDDRIMNVAQGLLGMGHHRPTQVVRHMTDAVHTFVGTAEQSDDLTMLAIQYKRETSD